ncbi:MAG: glycoside hydrolase family 2 TIM barrel-domain containing protein [Dehalococcoidia bacterium]
MAWPLATAGLIGHQAYDDGWELFADPPGGVGGWIPAIVPGDVRLSLIAAGLIPDPLVGRQADEGRWVAERDWRFRRRISSGTSRRFVIFDGIDYQSTITLDGRHLAQFEGMFSLRRIEIPQDGGLLQVRCSAPARLPKPKLSRLDRMAALLLRPVASDLFPDRLGVLKSQMGFGWDFAPPLPTVGLWDQIHLQTTGQAAIVVLRIDARPAREGAIVRLGLEVDCQTPGLLSAAVMIDDDEGNRLLEETRSWEAAAGCAVRSFQFALPQARRWQPWERGTPVLYRARVALAFDGLASDGAEARFGVRTVEMAAPADGGRGAPAEDCVRLILNGSTLYLRGANWVPNDALLGRLRREDYRQRLEQARAAGINLLRVWGGGLRERRAFYEIADELGLLIWQEFPFSVAFFDHFPRDERFVGLVENESRGIVRAVRNHPSVVIWCGGNEFNPEHNREVVSAVARAVAIEDGSRPFRAASPSAGERHNWRVWHGRANVADYRLERAPLLSEFGLQAAPTLESLRSFLPDNPAPGPDWEWHSAQLAKLKRYVPGEVGALDEFVATTQRAQAQGLQVAIEHVRRRKGKTTGTIFWQLNEPWGAICWSVIDYIGRPKSAYWRLAGCSSPVLVSLDFPANGYRAGERLHGVLWIVNDTLHPLDRLEVRGDVAGQVVFRRVAVVGANQATCLGPVNFVVPTDGVLAVRAERLGTVLCENHYDLAWHDPVEITRVDAVRDWVTWRVLH